MSGSQCVIVLRGSNLFVFSALPVKDVVVQILKCDFHGAVGAGQRVRDGHVQSTASRRKVHLGWGAQRS